MPDISFHHRALNLKFREHSHVQNTMLLCSDTFMNKKILMYHQLNQNAEAVWVTEWSLLIMTASEFPSACQAHPDPARTSPPPADLTESVSAPCCLRAPIGLSFKNPALLLLKKCKLYFLLKTLYCIISSKNRRTLFWSGFPLPCIMPVIIYERYELRITAIFLLQVYRYLSERAAVIFQVTLSVTGAQNFSLHTRYMTVFTYARQSSRFQCT